LINFVDQSQRANHYARPPTMDISHRWMTAWRSRKSGILDILFSDEREKLRRRWWSY